MAWDGMAWAAVPRRLRPQPPLRYGDGMVWDSMVWDGMAWDGIGWQDSMTGWWVCVGDTLRRAAAYVDAEVYQ
eukprot:9504109-Pyramimonas_sp.AAC.1